MQDSKVITTIEWQGISVKIVYVPIWSNAPFKGHVVSHIGVYADEALPITETGYRSIFLYQEKDKVVPSVDTHVLETLEEEAQSKKWKDYWKDRLINQSQLNLF